MTGQKMLVLDVLIMGLVLREGKQGKQGNDTGTASNSGADAEKGRHASGEHEHAFLFSIYSLVTPRNLTTQKIEFSFK
jgi:hypothetical protein